MLGRRAKPDTCQWLGRQEAFRLFATHAGGTQSARHIKPVHWYVACRLVLEGGFHPDDITPRPPFEVTRRGLVSFNPDAAGSGEEVVLGGLKTKNVDVVVTKPKLGPVFAISCKGATKAFRNLTNRMEETIGECTNLHITYPAMVVGYLVLLRANRTVEDALEAPDLESDEEIATNPGEAAVGQIGPNDIAVRPSGEPVEEIQRFHAALSELTGRRGIRDEISRYEAIALVLVEPRGHLAGTVLAEFPSTESPLHWERFFAALYQQYDERFVFGAPSLASRTRRHTWLSESPIFHKRQQELANSPSFDYSPRIK